MNVHFVSPVVVATIDRLSAQLDGLVGKEPPEALAGTRDAAALEIAQKTSALEALGPVAKEPRARERLEVEVKGQETALETARRLGLEVERRGGALDRRRGEESGE